MSIVAPPAATLGNTPLLHLLISIADRQLSGSLLFATPEKKQGGIVFVRGLPTKISLDTPQSRLSDLLVEFGWLGRPEADQTYAMALEQGVLHGRVLEDCSLVDKQGLTNLLCHQRIRKLIWLATQATETALVLHEGADRFIAAPPYPGIASPLSIIWSIARNHVNEQNKHAVLDRVANLHLSLHQRSAPELFGLNAAELALAEQLRHVKSSVDALLCQTDLPRQTAEALLYVLLLTRHIDIGDGRKPVGISVEPANAAPKPSGEYAAVRARTPEANQDSGKQARELREELLRLVSRGERGEHYSLFGVASDAPIEVIRTAFTALARRFHPERLPIELNDRKAAAAKLMTLMMAAYRELADPDRRAQYDSLREAPSSGAARERRVNRELAADALRRAEQLLKRDRLLLAAAHAQRALELAPDNPKCIALEAWIRSLIPESAGSLLPILEALNRAADLEPMNVQIRYFRSEIFKRLGRLEEAVGEWRLIIDLEPNHIDAQRELRLWALRSASSRPPRSSQSGTHNQVNPSRPSMGLFGRLFKGPR